MTRRRRQRSNQPLTFSSAFAPADESKRAPSFPLGRGPWADALLRPPIFPSSVRYNSMFYYESGLSETAPTSGNVINYFFSANGLFDPNITGTGHQPEAFDQLMLVYEQYTVVRSSIEVTFNLGATLSVRSGVSLFPDTTTVTAPGAWVENGLCKTVAMQAAASGLQNIRLQTIRMDCDVKKYFGRPSDQSLVNDVNLSGTTAANPTEQVYFSVGSWQINPDGSNTTAVGFDVLLSYDVIFWEPRKLASS